jgi:hypothetical protein
MLKARLPWFQRGLASLLWVAAIEGCIGRGNGDNARLPPSREPASTQVASTPDRQVHALPKQGITAPLTATGVTDSRIELSWSVKLAGVKSVRLWRSGDGNNWTPIARAPAATTQYADEGLDSSTIYAYRITRSDAFAVDALGEDAAGATLPKPPGPLTAIPLDGDVVLSWSKAKGKCDGYLILGSSDGKSFHEIAAVDENDTTYRDRLAADAVTDYYEVRSFAIGGDSFPSNIASATPIARIRAEETTRYDQVVCSVSHGQTILFAAAKLLGNFIDPNNDPVLRLRSFTQPSHGKVTDNGRGELTYIADKSYLGPDSFTYALTDQYNAPGDAATVRIAVTDAAPEAISGRITVVGAVDAGGRQLPHPAMVKGTLEARDADGDPLTFSAKVISGPGNFTLDDPTKGSYTFVPSESDHAPCLIEFTASDGIKTGNKASLIFPGWEVDTGGGIKAAGHVASRSARSSNRATIANRRFSVYQNGTLHVYASDGLLATARKSDRSSMPPSGLAIDPTPVEPVQHGSLSLSADGGFTYTAEAPAPDWFTCRTNARDGPGDYATVFIDVNPVDVNLWIEGWKPGDPNAVLPAAPAYATIHLKYPSDLPDGTLIALSVSGDPRFLVKVYDRVPRQSDGRLLFGGDTGKNSYAWTVGHSPTPPQTVYGVGADTKQDGVVFTVSVTVGERTIGTPSSEKSSTRPGAP